MDFGKYLGTTHGNTSSIWHTYTAVEFENIRVELHEFEEVLETETWLEVYDEDGEVCEYSYNDDEIRMKIDEYLT